MKTSVILDSIEGYITGLDWPYIMTLIILCYGINHFNIRKRLSPIVSTRLRVVLVGLVYGVVVYFLRGAEPAHAETLFESFVFAMVFHNLIVQSFFYWLAKHGLTRDVARHLLDEEELKKIYRK